MPATEERALCPACGEPQTTISGVGYLLTDHKGLMRAEVCIRCVERSITLSVDPERSGRHPHDRVAVEYPRDQNFTFEAETFRMCTVKQHTRRETLAPIVTELERRIKALKALDRGELSYFVKVETLEQVIALLRAEEDKS